MLSVSYLHRLSAADRMAVHHAVNVSIRLTDHQTGREVDLPLTESVSEVNSLRDAGRRIRDVAANMAGLVGALNCCGLEFRASAERLQREEHRLIYEPNVSTGPAPNSLREQERVQANERAVELLESNLSEEQSREMSKTGKFTVTASSGQRYLIDAKGGDYNVTSIDGAGVKLIDCCLDVGGDVPVADKVLVQKLLLEADEGRFLNIANTKCHYAPMAPPTMASDNLNWDTLRRPVAPPQQRSAHCDERLTLQAIEVMSRYDSSIDWSYLEIHRYLREGLRTDKLVLYDRRRRIRLASILVSHEEIEHAILDIIEYRVSEMCQRYYYQMRTERNIAASGPGITWANYNESDPVGDLRRLHDEMRESIGVDDD